MSDYLPPPSPLPPTAPNRVVAESSTPTTAMVLGILSIVLAGFPIVGLILGIIGIRKSAAAAAEIRAGVAPASAMGMVTAGKVCSIIGTCMAGLSTLVICLYMSCFGAMLLSGAAGAAAGGPGGSSSGYRSP